MSISEYSLSNNKKEKPEFCRSAVDDWKPAPVDGYVMSSNSLVFSTSQVVQDFSSTQMHSGPFGDLKNQQILGLRNQSFLQGNWLRTRPEGLFQNHSSLRGLGLNEHIFDGLESLRTLNMAWNQLEALPPRVFRNLSSLGFLYLQGNKLRTLPEGLFQNLSHLNKLNLSNNGLEVVEKRSFQGLPWLYAIDLSNNRLSCLPNEVFKDVGKETWWFYESYGWTRAELFLQGNKLTSFLPGALKGLKHLDHLDLSNNSLTTVDENIFDSLKRLRALNIAWNQLEALPPRVFRNLSSLNKLDLQGNKLRTLPEGLFRNLSSLSELHLQGNKLRTLPEGLLRNLSSLEKLDLQGNKLRTLPEGLLRNLSSLEKLDLSNNTLNMLPVGLFESQWLILEIDLSQNCLSIPPDELFGQLQCQAFENFTCLRNRRGFPLGASGAKRQLCMNLHDCREVGAKDALMEFVLQTFAEKKQGPVTTCFCWLFFVLGSQRQSDHHLTSFLVTAMHPPQPPFSAFQSL